MCCRFWARLGYAHVEGFGGVYEDPAAFRTELDRNGLTMPSGHFALDAFEGDFDGVRRIADTLGMSMLICPYLAPDDRPSDAAGWRAFGERLASDRRESPIRRIRVCLAQS